MGRVNDIHSPHFVNFCLSKITCLRPRKVGCYTNRLRILSYELYTVFCGPDSGRPSVPNMLKLLEHFKNALLEFVIWLDQVIFFSLQLF